MSTIKLKFGNGEIEYEGPIDFLKEELPSVLKEFVAIYGTEIKSKSTVVPGSSEPSHSVAKDLSILSIAAKLSVKSGSDLVLAAAASLTFSSGKPSFTRADLLTEMKRATGYFSQTNHRKNLSAYIGNLIKSQVLLQTQGDGYTLGASKKSELEKILAE